MSNRAKRKNPHEGKIVKFVHSENDPENADGVCGHLEEIGIVEYKPSFYENYLKRGLDILISFTSLLLLSPVLLMITLAKKNRRSWTSHFYSNKNWQD